MFAVVCLVLEKVDSQPQTSGQWRPSTGAGEEVLVINVYNKGGTLNYGGAHTAMSLVWGFQTEA